MRLSSLTSDAEKIIGVFSPIELAPSRLFYDILFGREAMTYMYRMISDYQTLRGNGRGWQYLSMRRKNTKTNLRQKQFQDDLNGQGCWDEGLEYWVS